MVPPWPPSDRRATARRSRSAGRRVVDPAEILPEGDVNVVGYQVFASSLQVTVPTSATSVTLPGEYYQSLEPGTHELEVLAIDESGNQTITEGTFVKP